MQINDCPPAQLSLAVLYLTNSSLQLIAQFLNLLLSRKQILSHLGHLCVCLAQLIIDLRMHATQLLQLLAYFLHFRLGLHKLLLCLLAGCRFLLQPGLSSCTLLKGSGEMLLQLLELPVTPAYLQNSALSDRHMLALLTLPGCQ